MHYHVDDGCKQRENGEELTEPEFKRGKVKPRTDEEVTAVKETEKRFAEYEHAIAEFKFNDGKDAETDEEHEEDDKVDLHGEHGNAEIPTEVFQEERADGGDEDAEERL